MGGSGSPKTPARPSNAHTSTPKPLSARYLTLPGDYPAQLGDAHHKISPSPRASLLVYNTAWKKIQQYQ